LLARAGDAVDSPKLRFPIIVKPALGVSLNNGKLGRDRFFLCPNETELYSALRTYTPGTPLLLQEYVTGTGEGLFGLATKDGVSAWSAHRRIRMMNPRGSGASACMSVTPEADDVAAGTRLIAHAGWRGLFMVELLRDADRRTWFVEFNGRVWGSMALARRCGQEYPAWAVLDALGETQTIPQKPSILPGVVCRHAGREAVHALFVFRGARPRNTLKWPSRWKTLRELLTFRTSEHWYNWKRDDWRVFLEDFVATLSGVLLRKRRKQ
jgi:predicted ATP-grasp superfamily ATP-dependent carboligase